MCESGRDRGPPPAPAPAPARPHVGKVPTTEAVQRDPTQKAAKDEEMRYKMRDGQTARGGGHVRGYDPRKEGDEGYPHTIKRS